MLAGAAPRRTPDWHSIDWRKVWRTVRRLQARIVKAVREGKYYAGMKVAQNALG